LKKYKIEFTADYLLYEEWANDGDKYWKEKIESNREELEKCRKWKGKEITIMELEDFVKEVGTIVFDGEVIEVYNDYRE